MGYLTDSLRALRTTMKNVFRRTTTVEFPKVVRPRPERFRTSFALLHDEGGDEACIGCLACERICPSQVIGIKQAAKRESPVTGKKRGYADDFVLDTTACIFCELCVQVCPTDAIVMLRVPEEPAYHREDLVLTMQKLYANEKLNKPRAWSNGSRLMEMQDPKRGQPKPEPKAAPEPKPAPTPKADAAASPAVAAAPAPAATAPASVKKAEGAS